MARPMLLIKEQLLQELYGLYKQGVPVLKLIRQFKLDNTITPPTLSKLLSYMAAMDKATGDIKTTIYNSLFPLWVAEDVTTNTIISSPFAWYYSGSMPLGEWQLRIDKQ